MRMFRGQIHKLKIPRKSRLVIAFSGGSCSTYESELKMKSIVLL